VRIQKNSEGFFDSPLDINIRNACLNSVNRYRCGEELKQGKKTSWASIACITVGMQAIADECEARKSNSPTLLITLPDLEPRFSSFWPRRASQLAYPAF
jgi:hypothetical protein